MNQSMLQSIRDRLSEVLADVESLIEPETGPVVRVSTAAELTAALASSAPGTTVLLEQGVYEGNFKVDRSLSLATADAVVEGRPTRETALARLVAPANGLPALVIEPGTVNVSLGRLGFQGPGWDILMIGRDDQSQAVADRVPTNITIDQVYVSGDPVTGGRRGIALHGGSVAITRSRVENIFMPGTDSQAIAGWNGPGPYLIEDCHLEAGSEVILFGGDDPTIPGMTPSDIIVRDCVLTRPVEWRGKPYNVKNLFELKTGKRVHVHHNLMEHNWKHAQEGFAVVLTVQNQGGTYHEACIEDVLIEDNIIRHTGGGVNVTGYDYRDGCWSGQLKGLVIRNNHFEISKAEWEGRGFFVMMGNGPRDITIEHNTVHNDGTQFVYHYSGDKRLPDNTKVPGGPVPGFVFRKNVVVRSGENGLMTMGGANGFNYQVSFPDGIVLENVLGSFVQPWRLPGNTFMSSEEVLGALPISGVGYQP